MVSSAAAAAVRQRRSDDCSSSGGGGGGSGSHNGQQPMARGEVDAVSLVPAYPQLGRVESVTCNRSEVNDV